MVFSEALRSRLAAQLRPWLREEPAVEVGLGFLRSKGKLSNLVFDISALNRLVRDSTGVVFKSAGIDELSFWICPWSSPAVSVEARGARVVLAPRDNEGRPGSTENYAEKEFMNVLASLDPKGVIIHDIIRDSLSTTASSGNRFANALARSLLQRLKTCFKDVSFEFELIEGSYACLLKAKELSLDPQPRYRSSLLSGIVGDTVLPQKDSYLSISCSSLDFGLKENDRDKCLVSARDISAYVRLNNLQLLGLGISVPRADFGFSPAEIPAVAIMLNLLSPGECKGVRSGRELWRIAAGGIHRLLFHSNTSLYRLFTNAVIWIQYVRAYESLLSTVGFCDDGMFKQRGGRGSRVGKCRTFVNYQMGMVNEIERKLPPQSVACARKIARRRALLQSHQCNGRSNHYVITSPWEILAFFNLFQNIVCYIFGLTIHFLLFMWNFVHLHREKEIPSLSSVFASVGTSSQDHFIVNVEELYITLSPSLMSRVPTNPKESKNMASPDSALFSFSLVVKTLCFVSTKDIITQSTYLALGEFQVYSSASSKSPHLGSYLEVEKFFPHKRSIESGDDTHIILWSEPALLNPSKEAIDDETCSSSSAWVLILENCLAELRADWKMICESLKQSNICYMHNPFLLYGLKNLSVDPNVNSSDHGLLKCCLTAGKLNLELEKSTVVCICLLFMQIQHSLRWLERPSISLISSTSTRETIVNLEEKLEFYSNELKVSLINAIPKKEMQIGVLVDGPKIKISSQGGQPQQIRKLDDSYSVDEEHRDSSILVDLGEITVALWPASKDVISDLCCNLEITEQTPNYQWLRKPPFFDIPEEHINHTVSSSERVTHNVFWSLRDLHASMESLEKSLQSPIIGPVSIRFQSSVCRDYFFSFFTTTDALAMALSGLLVQTAAVSYIEDLCVLFQEFESICSVLSSNNVNPSCLIIAYPEELARRFMTPNNMGSTKKIVTPGQDNSLVHKYTKFSIDAYFEVESVDVILNNLKKQQITRKTGGSTISNLSHRNLMTVDLPNLGIGVFLKKSHIHLFCGRGHVKALINLYGLESVIFCNRDDCVYTDLLKIKTQGNKSFNLLYKFSQSACVFRLFACLNDRSLPSKIMRDADDVSASTSSVMTNLLLHQTITGEGLETHLGGPDEEMFLACLPDSDSKFLIVLNFRVDEVIFAKYDMNLPDAAHQYNRLQMLLSISEEPYTIRCETKGGHVFLETSALAAFVQCFRAYSLCITSLLTSMRHSSEQFGRDQDLVCLGDNKSSQNNDPTGSFQGIVSHDLSSETWKGLFLAAVTINISQSKITFAVTDGSGGIQELVIEADSQLKLIDMGRKFAFEVSRLTVLSQRLRQFRQDNTGINQIPHFHSNKLSDLPSLTGSGAERAPAEIEDAYTTPISNSLSENIPENSASQILHVSYDSCILKHLVSSFVFEKTDIEVGPQQLKDYWVGDGSISGFDLAITLSEIQMLLDLGAPLSAISTTEVDHNLNLSTAPRSECQNSSDHTIADGAVVAIQDIEQHMYFAVEAVGRKYCLVGVLHYSLVGEKALFRVKYHTTKRWRSTLPRFFLMSLHAKNDAGEPLCLNFCPGSDFVEISNSEKNSSLWETSPYIADSQEKDDDLKSFDISSRKAFHLVNSKSQCAVAFVDGLPEFVKKPGNPFKVKVFHDSDLLTDSRGVLLSKLYTCESYRTDFRGNSFCVAGLSWQITNLFKITIDKITLMIFHEVSDANDKFPLVQGYIDGFHVTGQSFPTKLRLIGKFKIAAFCFDGQQNLWSEFISPVDTCFFFRSRFTLRPAGNNQQRVPVRFYFSTRQIDASLSELSLDVLLFLFWKLDMIGPYAVRRSVIFANFCKVENNVGLSLLCNFSNNQEAIVPGKQTAFVALSTAAMGHQLLEKESLVSLRLSGLSSFSTSPVQISLSKPCLFAWRTRVVSLQGSRTFPGAFLVVEVSKKTEDGLMVVLSPLLRIHNESGFSMRLRVRRPSETESDSASVFLRNGDVIDDSMAAFDALNYSGGLKKALMSLGLGNFLLSLKPEISENLENTGKPVSVDWSEDLKGGKAVRISGIFDKLSYRFRKALGVESVKSFFSMMCCPLVVDGVHISNLFFLIHTVGREVPVLPPENMGVTSQTKTSPVAFQLQKEIFILPTIHVFNYLQTEIIMVLSDERHPDLRMIESCFNYGKQAIIPCGSSACFYVNPATIDFTVTLSAFNSTCKPVNSGDWVNTLHKQKKEVNHFDTDLDFGGGKQFAKLRLSRGDRGILEASVFTPYKLQNNTELSLCCFAYSQKNIPRNEAVKCSSIIPPELGSILPPKSSSSWFLKSNKLQLQQMDEKASEVLLDLDALSGVTEISLEAQNEAGITIIAKLGVSVAPCIPKMLLPSQTVCLVPRYVISNESNTSVTIRQCYLEDDVGGITTIEGNGRAVLYMRTNLGRRRETSFFDAMLKKHRNESEDSMDFIQFQLEDVESSWSGPICVASLGRFFLKFKKQESSPSKALHSSTRSMQTLFANVHIVEENSSLVLHFYMPPKFSLPYRIENCLHNAAISYYQKDSEEPETLGSGNSVEYVWDDLNLPHKLVIQIAGINALREINIDKVRTWKPFLKTRHTGRLALHLPLDNKLEVQKKNAETNGFDMLSFGYEVLTDGLTRVLRVCEFVDSYKEERMLVPRASIQLRFACLAINLLDGSEQDDSSNELKTYSAILVARFLNIAIDSVITEKSQYNCMMVQSIIVDEKWQGAPFTSMIRRQLNDSSVTGNMLSCVFYLTSSNSSVRQVKYSSIVLQPVDLNLDEETLMRLLKFRRASISDSETASKMYYFEHFEIHPIKIRASFLPGNQYSSYSSAQEALRSFLHNVIKVPNIKNSLVELNGVLLTHALVTTRELGIKCAQHYSWYLVRAVYKAKGSPLLPPAFVSIFDDSASSSLDVFFDPSDGSINIPGVTLGMFKFIKTCISSKGFTGTKRYFGDLGKTVKRAGSNALFAAITEVSDNVLLGAETNGFSGMVSGFHQGILKLAMEPDRIGAAFMEGGPDRRITLDRNAGVDELYIEGYLQALLDAKYKQEYLRVRVNDNQVFLKNLPPNSSFINEIVGEVKGFLVSKGLLKGEASTARSIHQLRGESEWKFRPTVLTLCEHLFVSFAIRMLRKETTKLIVSFRLSRGKNGKEEHASSSNSQAEKLSRVWVVGRFALSGMVAYIDGRMCRHIPNPIARRIVSGFLLSFLDKQNTE